MSDELGDAPIENVRCKDTGKLLARMSKEGLYLYCKECKTEHLFLWDELHPNRAREGERIGVTSGFVL